MSEQPPPPPPAGYPSPFGPWFNPSMHPSMQMHPHMHPLAHYQLQHFYAAQGLPVPPFLAGPSPATSSASASTPAVPSPTRSNVEPSPSTSNAQHPPDQLGSNPASIDTPSVEAENPSPASFVAAASSASPVSPLGQSTGGAAGRSATQHDPTQPPPPPPPPLSDPRALLQRSLQGLYQLVSTGNFDARPSRQGPGPPPRSGACAACRTAKAKCNQQEPACDRCVKMKVECTYPVFNKRGRKRTRTP